MKYITDEDLMTDSYQSFITETTQHPETLNKIEARIIAYVTTMIKDRYNTDLIFTENDPLRNEVLVDIMCKLILYKLFRRNAPRKVSTDIKEDNDWALKQLEKINTGRLVLSDLPLITGNDGSFPSQSIWGNNTNHDFYI